jgi:hypothetical protein
MTIVWAENGQHLAKTFLVDRLDRSNDRVCRSRALAVLACVQVGVIGMMSPCLASFDPRQPAPVPMVWTEPGIVVAAAAAAPPSGVDDSLSRGSAARSRMLECGHQWSAMKKAGTATGTWKEFARVCLNKG